MQKNSQVFWFQKEISIKTTRGCKYILEEVLKGIPEISNIKIGQLNLFLKHTSASITLNENWDKDVLVDMENSLNRIVPEDEKLYIHTCEGPDDMPGHVKSSLIGVSHNIPITNGKLNMGTWQGIWICEHRDGSRTRSIVLTANGIG